MKKQKIKLTFKELVIARIIQIVLFLLVTTFYTMFLISILERL